MAPELSAVVLTNEWKSFNEEEETPVAQTNESKSVAATLAALAAMCPLWSGNPSETAAAAVMATPVATVTAMAGTQIGMSGNFMG